MDEVNLTEEQAEQIKAELKEQLVNFPEEKRSQIEGQIDSMSIEQVEAFVKQNQLGHLDPNKCIFCLIVSGDTPSVKIGETDKEIAVLDINPMTKGHTLIVPKKHEDKPSQDFVTMIGDLLQEKLKVKDVQVGEAEVMGHNIVNLIPVYDDTDLSKKERLKVSKDELEKLREVLIKEEKKISSEPVKPIEVKKEPVPRLPPRIP